jgi:hypothetical protein
VETRLRQAPHYVINVRKPGYALLSRAVYSATPEMNLLLDRATRTICNPASACVASDQGPSITTQVQIDANSLVDQNGHPATVPVNVDVHGYDMSLPDPIPGDLAALDKSGKLLRSAWRAMAGKSPRRPTWITRTSSRSMCTRSYTTATPTPRAHPVILMPPLLRVEIPRTAQSRRTRRKRSAN